jgi:hypothetical protein
VNPCTFTYSSRTVTDESLKKKNNFIKFLGQLKKNIFTAAAFDASAMDKNLAFVYLKTLLPWWIQKKSYCM